LARAKFGFSEELVLAGVRAEQEGELARLAGCALEGIHCLGSVLAADMPLLYAGAACFVFPSFYEGFGLPVLEAMACGTPVICSSVASLPEVAGAAAVMVDPASGDELVQALGRVLGQESLREEMRNRGLAQARKFSWQDSAQKVLDLLEDLGRHRDASCR